VPPALSEYQAALLEWGAGARRDLPWRRTRDPWAVLVSELMLQQTQVSRVVPAYTAFLVRFPTPAACADAPVGDVVRAWGGLGYNRRAVSLHRAAVAVVDRFAGSVPAGLDELLDLPGVGPYTARAVLAFAWDADVGVVDTNAARVLARAVAGRPLGSLEAQSLADAVVPESRGWAWNQAVLDLGATVCRRRYPRCHGCPLAAALACAWAAGGHASPDPAEGSAGVGGRQAAFPGSDRQGRGRLVDALRRGPVALAAVAPACGWPDDPDRAAGVASDLVHEGLAVVDGDQLRLP
jgi:A/G-specific adenine glycosylase